MLISTEELFGRGTVIGEPPGPVAGNTGHPSTRIPFVPSTTKNAWMVMSGRANYREDILAYLAFTKDELAVKSTDRLVIETYAA